MNSMVIFHSYVSLPEGILFLNNPNQCILSVWELKHNMDEKFTIKLTDPIKYTVNKPHQYNVNKPWLIKSEGWTLKNVVYLQLNSSGINSGPGWR